MGQQRIGLLGIDSNSTTYESRCLLFIDKLLHFIPNYLTIKYFSASPSHYFVYSFSFLDGSEFSDFQTKSDFPKSSFQDESYLSFAMA
jgi:hypothetical protein